MTSNQVQAKKMLAAAAIALSGVVAGACTQQPVAPLAPTPVAGNVALGAQGANTALLCHARGNGTFAPLWVNPNAIGGHLAHGDGRALDEAPGGQFVFTTTCDLVLNVAGTWVGKSTTFDPNSDPPCGQDLNKYRLTLEQSGSDVSGEVYWEILESYFPPDICMVQTAPLTSGNVAGNTFTFSYGPAQLGLVASATVTGSSMSGTLTLSGSSACAANTFELIRQ
jgi:hypothetical protein